MPRRSKYDWTAVDPLLGELPDREIQTRFGIPMATVSARRRKLGLSSPQPEPKKAKAILDLEKRAEVRLAKGARPPKALGDEEAERALLRHGPWGAAMPYFFHVVHRDRVGSVVPLRLSALQEHIAQQVDIALEAELEYLMQVDRENRPVYIHNFRRRLKGVTSARQALREGIFSPFEIGLKANVLKSRRGGSSTFFLCAALRACLSTDQYSACSWSEIKDSMIRIFKLQRTAVENWRTDIELDAETIELGRNAAEKHTFGNGSTHLAKTVGSTTRGDRVDFLHLTEYAHYEVMDDVAQAMMVARPHAWVIRETTANGKNHFYVDWEGGQEPSAVLKARREGRYSDLRGWNGFYNIFFPWWADPGLMLPCTAAESKSIAASLDEYETRLTQHAPQVLTYGHLKFRREAIKKYVQQDLEGLTPEAFFDQEYPWSSDAAFQSTAKTVFDLEAVDYQAQHVIQEPLSFHVQPEQPAEIAKFGLLKIYERPQPRQAYVLSADVSHGVGFDYADLKVFNRHDGTKLTEAASVHSARISPGVLAWVSCILAYLYNDAFIVAEALGGGVGYLDAIVNRMGYFHVYYRPAAHIETSHQSYSTNPKMGVWWSHPLKAAAVDRLNEALKVAQSNNSLVLRSGHTVEQLRLFAFDGKKYEAPKGYFDDAVSCLLMLMLVQDDLPPVDEVNVVKKAKEIAVTSRDEVDDIHAWAWDRLDQLLRSPVGPQPRRRLVRRRRHA